MANSSNSSKRSGNNKDKTGSKKPLSLQTSPVKHWTFTLNNWSQDEIDLIVPIVEDDGGLWLIGKEIGKKEGTPHLHGYIAFKQKKRFSAVVKMLPRARWEPADNVKAYITYCKKDGNYMTNIPVPLKDRLLAEYNETIWNKWQKDILNMLDEEPIKRKVYWYWDKIGNVGKSYISKYIYLKYDAIIASGKKTDVFNQINTWMDSHLEESPKVVILDIPRANINYLNYGMLEEIKGGLIYSGKYEGGRKAFFPPHIIVFANSPPITSEFSLDRWNIVEIKK